jgi:hypothetical protein
VGTKFNGSLSDFAQVEDQEMRIMKVVEMAGASSTARGSLYEYTTASILMNVSRMRSNRDLCFFLPKGNNDQALIIAADDAFSRRQKDAMPGDQIYHQN